jgi:hypothetical protein
MRCHLRAQRQHRRRRLGDELPNDKGPFIEHTGGADTMVHLGVVEDCGLMGVPPSLAT